MARVSGGMNQDFITELGMGAMEDNDSVSLHRLMVKRFDRIEQSLRRMEDALLSHQISPMSSGPQTGFVMAELGSADSGARGAGRLSERRMPSNWTQRMQDETGSMLPEITPDEEGLFATARSLRKEGDETRLTFKAAAKLIKAALEKQRSGSCYDLDSVAGPAFMLRLNLSQAKVDSTKKGKSRVFGIDKNKTDSLRKLNHEYSSDKQEQLKPWWVLHPSCKVRMIWDFIGVLAVFFDMLNIPVQLAFKPDESPGTQAVGWFILIFWTCDIPLSFFTGFYSGGHVVLTLRKIARNYILSWLVLDIAVVSIDWVSNLLHSDSMEAITVFRGFKAVRILRIMRALRLLRLMKLRKAMDEMQDHVQSDVVTIVMTIFQYMFMIVMINHFIACGWFGLSTSLGSDEDLGNDTWVRSGHFTAGAHTDHWTYKYITSLHWSLTQFTPASMEVLPKNFSERLFAVMVLIFALIVFSSFLSSITAAMTQLRSLHGAHDKNMSLLRKFLRSRQIGPELSARILRFVEHQLVEHRREIQEQEVTTLKLLSKPLQMELVQETYSPVLKTHVFFRYFEQFGAEAMKQLCVAAVSPVSLSVGDVAFAEGSRSESMLFLRKGKLRYFIEKQLGMNSFSSDEFMSEHVHVDMAHSLRSRIIEAGEWCCEYALWTDWVHIGTAMAVKNSEILALSGAAFGQVLGGYSQIAKFGHAYGTQLVAYLNSEARRSLTDVPSADDCQEISKIAQKSFPNKMDAAMASVRNGSFAASFMGLMRNAGPNADEMGDAGEASPKANAGEDNKATDNPQDGPALVAEMAPTSSGKAAEDLGRTASAGSDDVVLREVV